MKRQVVHVKAYDHAIYLKEEEEVEDDTLPTIEVVGLLLRETDDVLVIELSRTEGGGSDVFKLFKGAIYYRKNVGKVETDF